MASITARKKIVKEAGQPVDELEEQVAQVRDGRIIRAPGARLQQPRRWGGPAGADCAELRAAASRRGTFASAHRRLGTSDWLDIAPLFP